MDERREENLEKIQDMAEKETTVSNVVSLSNWRKTKRLDLDQNQYAQYLQKLQDSELVHEVYGFISDFQDTEITEIHFRKGKMILNELSHRVSGSSQAVSGAIQELKQNLATRLTALSNLNDTDH